MSSSPAEVAGGGIEQTGPPSSRGRSATSWLLASLVVLVCAAALSLSAWSGKPNWSNADSLFYQSMSLEVEGASAQAARAKIFGGELAGPAIRQEPSVAEASWQNYEAQFSRRRWLVPALAAAIRPVAGTRALPDVAIVGYLVFGLALFLLLATSFSLAASVAATTLCLALGPVLDWGLRPMTDSWGLALEVTAILGSLLFLSRGMRWLALWIASMLALSFTRDLAIIPLAGVAWLILRDRDPARRRQGLTLILSGVLVTLPAYVLFGASLRSTLAFQINAFEIPSAAHATWAYVAAHYPALLWSTTKADLHYAFIGHPLVGLTMLTGLVSLFAVPARGDTFTLVMRGAALGCLAVFALDPDFSGFRYELTLLPPTAAGLCALAEYAAGWYRGRGAAPVLDARATS